MYLTAEHKDFTYNPVTSICAIVFGFVSKRVCEECMLQAEALHTEI